MQQCKADILIFRSIRDASTLPNDFSSTENQQIIFSNTNISEASV